MTSNLDHVPEAILAAIAEGRAVLFLGAGCSKSAITKNRIPAPDSDELARKINEKYLDSNESKLNLARIAEYAKNYVGQKELQNFIAQFFIDLEPTKQHLLIPKFPWKAIFTTNYDTIIEKAYERCVDRVQIPAVVIRKGDFERAVNTANSVPIIKLHGCCTVIDDEACPLILATEEYAKYRIYKKAHFDLFSTHAKTSPVIFCGYDLSDTNVIEILFDIGSDPNTRPAYVSVSPDIPKHKKDWLYAKRIIPIAQKFEEFIEDLRSSITDNKIELAKIIRHEAGTFKRILSYPDKVSGQGLAYADQNFEIVTQNINTESVSPKDFYHSLKQPWSAFELKYDVIRGVHDDIASELYIDSDDVIGSRFFLLEGYAGAGKSVCLRRIAWTGALDFDATILWLKPSGFIDANYIRELVSAIGKRVVVFVDSALMRDNEITKLLSKASNEKWPIDIVSSARTNEWNVGGEGIDKYVTHRYELRNLNDAELESLIGKLCYYKLVPEELLNDPDGLKDILQDSYDRQLLVSLHEATSEKGSFEEIIYDEYLNIVPEEAKYLYLDVCTLHKLDVPIRAGLISRISGITFQFFHNKLLAPLEHVVKARYDGRCRDYVYETRHKIIADMVCKQVLKTQEERANQICRIIRFMNPEYTTDRIAFDHLIKGKVLAESFSDRLWVDQIYEAAEESAADSSYILHQRSVFELNHPGGGVDTALKYIDEAIRLSNNITDSSLKHTRANALYKKATKARNDLEKQKYLNDAKSILIRQCRKNNTPHPFSLLGQIYLYELDDFLVRLSNGEHMGIERAIEGKIAELEKLLSNYRSGFPDDEFIITIDAKLAEKLSNYPRVVGILDAAFKKNPTSGMLAVRLAKQHERASDIEKAVDILTFSLEKNPFNREVNEYKAILLIQIDEESNHELICTLLRKSFQEQDAHYIAQFWYARQQYLFGDRSIANRVFGHLSNSNVGNNVKNRIRGVYIGNQKIGKKYTGRIAKKSESYGFISCVELHEEIFCHYSNAKPEEWDRLRIDDVVEFSLAFNFKGSCAIEISAKF